MTYVSNGTNLTPQNRSIFRSVVGPSWAVRFLATRSTDEIRRSCVFKVPLNHRSSTCSALTYTFEIRAKYGLMKGKHTITINTPLFRPCFWGMSVEHERCLARHNSIQTQPLAPGLGVPRPTATVLPDVLCWLSICNWPCQALVREKVILVNII